METNPSGAVLYTTSENNLSPSISEFTEYVYMNRSASYVSTGGGDQEVTYKSDITINTGYISNWILLSNEDKKKFIAERKKQRVRLENRKGSKTGNELDTIEDLKNQNYKFKKNIKPLKNMVTQ